MTRIAFALTDKHRPLLKALALFAGAVSALAGIGCLLDNYSAIKVSTLYVLTAGGTFWFPVLAALACWAIGHGTLTVRGVKAIRVIAPALVMNAAFLIAAISQFPAWDERNFYHIVFIGAACLLPVVTYGVEFLMHYLPSNT